MKIERDSFLFATDFEWKDRGAGNRERERERERAQWTRELTMRRRTKAAAALFPRMNHPLD